MRVGVDGNPVRHVHFDVGSEVFTTLTYFERYDLINFGRRFLNYHIHPAFT
jgi:hypothetical protein